MPPITKNLLIINVLTFFGSYVIRQVYGIDADRYLGLHLFLSDNFNLLQPLTYMFMHGGFSHLLCNMFALWMFGRVLEQMWGGKRFLLFYLVCGIGAGLVQEAVQGIRFLTAEAGMSPDEVEAVLAHGTNAWNEGKNFIAPQMAHLNALLNSGTVGASGSIFGILLGFGMSFPEERIFVMPLPFPIKAKYFVAGYAVIEILMGMANNPYDNVAHFAHLGGMVFGFLLIMYWKRKNRNNGYYYYN